MEREIVYSWSDQHPPILADVNLHISAGSFALLAGTNGSGKTTLAKLFAGLLSPSRGDILINGLSTSQYADEELRSAAVYVSSSEVLYPVSLRENIVMGLGTVNSISLFDLDNRIEEAVELAGASEIISRFGYSAVLNPCTVNAYTIGQKPGKAALAALDRYSPCHSITLSDSDVQRLIA